MNDKPRGYADLYELSEDERIGVIGTHAEAAPIGFFVEDDDKADRYVRKLVERFNVREISRGPFSPNGGTGMLVVKVGPGPVHG